MDEKTQEAISALRNELKSLSFDSTNHTKAELVAYLQIQGSVSNAAAAVIASERWKKEHPVSINDAAPFLRAPPGETYPAGGIVCLEDMKGGVARDSNGRPIILCFGMPHGSAEEMKKVTSYALERAAKYCLPGHAPAETCLVVEVSSRESNRLNASFRFPDANSRSLLDFMRAVYPGSQLSHLYFCGVPYYVVSFFAMCRPFMPAVLYNRLSVKSNFKHLKKDGKIPIESLLSDWDKQGQFEFDFDKYIEWRCKEEGIDNVCAKGEGRSYEGAVHQIPVSTGELLVDVEHREDVIKYGPVQKKGSGKGLFASTRWKTKLLVLQPGLLVYFDSKEVSSSNHASRMVPIDAESTVERDNGSGSNAGVVIKSLQREYLFRFNSETEAEEWTNLIREQCSTAVSASA